MTDPALLRALASSPRLWEILPGDGPASQWLIDAVTEATGSRPRSADSQAPVNMARIRLHLRNWAESQLDNPQH